MEGIVFHVFDTLLKRKNQGVSSNLFVLCLKFSAFFLTASSALRKILKFHINVKQGLKDS